MTRADFWQEAFLAAYRVADVNIEEAELCADDALACFDKRFPHKVVDEQAGYRDPALRDEVAAR